METKNLIDKPWSKKGIKSKQIIISLPEKLIISGEALTEILEKKGLKCPLCGLPWPEKFELPKEKNKILGLSLPEKLVNIIQCFESTNRFIRIMLEIEKGICPICKQ